MSLALLKQKRDQRAEITSNRQAIVEEGEKLAAKENLSEADNKRLLDLAQQRAANDHQLANLDGQIEILESVGDMLREFTGDGAPRQMQDPLWGFESMGAYYAAVYQADGPGRRIVDERLVTIKAATATTYGNESSGADGGFAVPPQISTEIRAHELEEMSFLPLTDGTPLAGNSMAFPTTEVTPWGTNGAKAYWRDEGDPATQSRLKLELVEMRLNELTALVPMSGELLDDAPALGARVTREAGAAIRWKTNDSLVNGNGAGKPLGFMNSGALVTVAKETSQTAATVNATNVAKMWARQLNPMNSYWVMNPDVWPQLITMTIGNQPIWTPPQAGMTRAPGGFLLGRPIMASDTHQTVGSLGDISFVNWRAYAAITKAAGIQADTSMHLWFDQNLNAFRFIFRIDGQPWLKDPVTPPNSSATRSPFVVLAERS